MSHYEGYDLYHLDTCGGVQVQVMADTAGGGGAAEDRLSGREGRAGGTEAVAQNPMAGEGGARTTEEEETRCRVPFAPSHTTQCQDGAGNYMVRRQNNTTENPQRTILNEPHLLRKAVRPAVNPWVSRTKSVEEWKGEEKAAAAAEGTEAPVEAAAAVEGAEAPAEAAAAAEAAVEVVEVTPSSVVGAPPPRDLPGRRGPSCSEIELQNPLECELRTREGGDDSYNNEEKNRRRGREGRQRFWGCCCGVFPWWAFWLVFVIACIGLVINAVLGGLLGSVYRERKRSDGEQPPTDGELPPADGSLVLRMLGTAASLGPLLNAFLTNREASGDSTALYGNYTALTVAQTVQAADEILAAARSLVFRTGMFRAAYGTTSVDTLPMAFVDSLSYIQTTVLPFLKTWAYRRAGWLAGEAGVQLTCQRTASAGGAALTVDAMSDEMALYALAWTGGAASSTWEGLMRSAMADARSSTTRERMWRMVWTGEYGPDYELTFSGNSTAVWGAGHESVMVATPGQAAVGPARVLQPVGADGVSVMADMHRDARWAPTSATFVVVRCRCPSGDEHTVVAREAAVLRLARTHQCAVVPVEVLLTAVGLGVSGALALVPRLVMGLPGFAYVGPLADMPRGALSTISALNSNTGLLKCVHDSVVSGSGAECGR